MKNDSQWPPSELAHNASQLDKLVDFWNGLRASEDCGATTWEVLESIEKDVVACLAASPQQIHGAMRLTAIAMHLMSGSKDL